MPAATRWPASLRARTRPARSPTTSAQGLARAAGRLRHRQQRERLRARRDHTGRVERRHAVRRPAGRRRAVGHRHDVPATAPPTSRSTGDVTITFSEPVDVAADAFTHLVLGQRRPRRHRSPAARPPSRSTRTADFARDETCTVTVSAAGVTDQDADDPPNTLAGDFTFSFSTLGLAGLRIHDIQAAQHISPHDERLRGRRAGRRDRGPRQRLLLPGPDGRTADPETSEGIFVFTGSARGQAGGRPGDHGHRPRRRVPARRRGHART